MAPRPIAIKDVQPGQRALVKIEVKHENGSVMEIDQPIDIEMEVAPPGPHTQPASEQHRDRPVDTPEVASP